MSAQKYLYPKSEHQLVTPKKIVIKYFHLVHCWIDRHPIWIPIAILPNAVADVIQFVYKYVRNGIHRHRSQIHEVIIFNELSYACVFDHRKHENDCIPFRCLNEYCSLRHVERIAEQLDRALFSIDLAMYSLSSLEIIEALKAALRRRVKVRIISNYGFTQFEAKIKSLLPLGARVRLPDSSKLMHHKFCVIDGNKQVSKLLRERRNHLQSQPTTSVAICGSVNWTNGGFGANMEDCLITSNTLITTQLELEFGRMWREFRARR